MAVYSGREDGKLDVIALFGISESQVKRIYDDICTPDIGELRFMSDFYDLRDVGLRLVDGVWTWSGDRDFDGWAYPDGSRFSAQDFPDAFAEYGNPGDSSFAVPDLTDRFFKGSTQALNADVPQKSELQLHDHSLTDEKGIQTELSIYNGFVFCAAGNCNSFRTQKYYTHPATIDQNGHKITGNRVGTMRPVNTDDPNYPPEGVDPKKWSLAYTVPALHSGISGYDPEKIGNTCGKFLPFPLDLKLKLSDIAALFADQNTERAKQDPSYPHPVGSGKFAPESVCVPAMIYIGLKRV